MYAESAAELVLGVRGRFGDGPPDPEDVVQEAFQRVFARADTTNIRNLKAYVWRTARNLVFEDRKRESVRTKYELEIERLYFAVKGENLSPENVITAREQLAAINATLSGMSDRRRRAFLLYRIEGLTLERVADTLQISITAVRKHVSRAQAQLHALFIDPPAEDSHD